MGQADLNWENPAVVREMQEVVDFWVDLGADGFRIDVIDQISKDFPGDRNCFGPRLHEYIRDLFDRDSTRKLFTVGECWAGDIAEVRRHCTPERGELSTLFQFEHLNVGREDKFTRRPGSMAALWDILRGWEEKMQENDLLYSLFTDNHDNCWLLERVGDTGPLRYASATAIAAMVYLMRGVCFLYQGQEIGMVNPHYDSIDDFDDVESKNQYTELLEEYSQEEALEKINFGSRDNNRRPMCWDGSAQGGFTTGKPWIPLHSAHATLNLQADQASKQSVWRFYRDLLRLRKTHPALTTGSFRAISQPGDSYCAYERREGAERLLLVCNFEKAGTIDLPGASGAVLLSNYGHAEKTDTHYEPYEMALFAL